MKNLTPRCCLAPTALLVIAALSCSSSAPPSSEETRPNIVVLFADDLGYGDLASFGHPTIRTPNLDQLAAEGMRLTSFYSAPWCVPARLQLMTGRYSGRIDVGRTGVDGDGSIPESETTMAQALGAAGYRTGMVGKWHLGYAREEYLPVGKGFDSWFGLPYSNDMRRPWVDTDEPLWLYDNTTKVEHPVDQDTLTTRYTERAVDFIKQGDGQPFFLYAAYSMPHLPVHTAEEFQGRSRAGLYGDVIETIDWSVGQIVAAIEETGQTDNTIIVFTSDNGPWLNLPSRMLQDEVEPWHTGSPGPLRGAKATTYEGGVRVPFIIRWPARIEPGRVSADIVSTIDLLPTFLAASGAAAPQQPLDGLDLTPFLSDASEQSPRDDFYYFYNRRLEGVRKGPWKLRTLDGIELFNLDLDPSERYNRAEDRPDVVEELNDLMTAMRNEVDAD